MRLAWIVLFAALAGCGGSRCNEVERARQALVRTGTPGRGADVRVTVPYDPANEMFAGLLAQELATFPIDPPDLGPIELDTTLTAVVTSLRIQPAKTPGRVGFTLKVAVRDRDQQVAEMSTLLEVTPVITRDDHGTLLTVGFRPQSIAASAPIFGGASEQLRDAVKRWIPDRLKTRVPNFVIDAAAKKLYSYLADKVWKAVFTRLGDRIDKLARVQLRLPDVPVASTVVQSTDKALVVDITTDLPVRRGLVPGIDDQIGVRISGSAAAELANWAIEKGHAPRWYNRSIDPVETGEFRPRFDYVAEDHAHPFKVYSFQERGGCSYFRVGVKAALEITGDKLKATVLDRHLEKEAANPVIEAAAWTKFFVTGWLDQSKKVAAHTRLEVGGRTLDTRVVKAAIVDDEVRFELQFGPRP